MGCYGENDAFRGKFRKECQNPVFRIKKKNKKIGLSKDW